MDNMENTDLKWIKKHYGEKFSHLCRDLFPTILETEGLLSRLIGDRFVPSRELYEDIISHDLTINFKNYIYSLANKVTESSKEVNLSPEELMDRAGYILYPECKTEKDIQSFRHYYYRGEPTPIYTGGKPEYRKGEELYTFNGGRLDSCRVWFAVKKNVDEIKRKDFKNPRREDDYGISVISIQFSKTNPSTLSIKNRYNHAINCGNPDATFSNNLDNIIEGLTQAFVNTYNINLLDDEEISFKIPNYVQAADNKFYKYNYEIGDIYYCPNNTIIEHGEVKILDQNKFVLFDHFVLDIENKKIYDYINPIEDDVSLDTEDDAYEAFLDSEDDVYLDTEDAAYDAFPDSVGEIQTIKRIPTTEGLIVQITPSQGEVIEIFLNKHNCIIGYSNPNATYINDKFLYENNTLIQLSLPNVQQIGYSFLYYNKTLKQISLPNVQKIDIGFLFSNKTLTDLSLPSVQQIGNNFLSLNRSLIHLSLPSVQLIGDNFLYYNETLKQISLPNIQQIGYSFLYSNKSLRNHIVEEIRDHDAEKI